MGSAHQDPDQTGTDEVQSGAETKPNTKTETETETETEAVSETEMPSWWPRGLLSFWRDCDSGPRFVARSRPLCVWRTSCVCLENLVRVFGVPRLFGARRVWKASCLRCPPRWNSLGDNHRLETDGWHHDRATRAKTGSHRAEHALRTKTRTIQGWGAPVYSLSSPQPNGEAKLDKARSLARRSCEAETRQEDPQQRIQRPVSARSWPHPRAAKASISLSSS